MDETNIKKNYEKIILLKSLYPLPFSVYLHVIIDYYCFLHNTSATDHWWYSTSAKSVLPSSSQA